MEKLQSAIASDPDARRPIRLLGFCRTCNKIATEVKITKKNYEWLKLNWQKTPVHPRHRGHVINFSFKWLDEWDRDDLPIRRAPKITFRRK